MSGEKRSGRCIGLSILVLLLPGSFVIGADPADVPNPEGNRVQFRELFVPRNQIADWVRTGRWTPVTKAEYDRIRAAATPTTESPSSTRITDANYRAVFTDGALRGGTLEAVVQNDAESSVLLKLSPTSLVIQQIAWRNGPAKWGTNVKGDIELVAPPGIAQFCGEWSQAARKFSRSSLIEMEFPPAMRTRLRLTTPSGFQLNVANALVTGPQPANRPGWSDWLIDLGSRTQARIQIAPEDSAREDDVPTMLTQSNFLWDVREDGLRFSAGFDIDVVRGQTSSLSFLVPGDLTVHRVTSGVETRLPWSSTTVGAKQRIDVSFDEPQRGRLRRIQIEGTAPVRLGEAWTLPGADVSDGFFVTGQAVLQVENSLVVDRVEARWMMQTGVSRGDQGQETQFFRQDQENADLVITVAYPKSQINATSLSEMSIQDDHWICRCETEWNATSGATFLVGADISADWEVLEVRAASNGSTSDTFRWDVTRLSEDRRGLVVEFQETLHPGNPKRLIISMRQLPTASNSKLAIPVFRPTGCEVSRGLTFLPSNVESPGSAAFDWNDVAARTSIADYETFRLLSDMKSRNDRPSKIYWSSDAANLKTDAVLKLPRSIIAKAWQTVEIGPDSARSVLALRIESSGRMLRKAYVYLSGNPSVEPPAWSLLGSALPIHAVKLPESALQERGLPPGGELWELTFPESDSASWNIRGEWYSLLQSQTSLRLPFVANADQMFAAVELSGTGVDGLDVQPRGMLPLTVSAANSHREELGLGAKSVNRSWQYDSPADRIHVSRKRPETPSILPGKSRAWLQTVLSPATGIDLNRLILEWDVAQHQDRLEFSMAAECRMRSVRVDGESVGFTLNINDGLLQASVACGTGWKRIIIDYETPVSPVSVLTRRQTPCPQISGVIDFRWDLAVPAGIRIDNLTPELAVSSRPVPLTWSQRLFGVFGRGHSQTFFLPGWNSRETIDSNSQEEGSDRLEFIDKSDDTVILTALADHLPDGMELRLSSRQLTSQLGWLTFLTALLMGTLIRVLMPSRSDPLILILTIFALTASLVSPDPLAIAAGSALVGLTISLIIPPSLFRPRKKSSTLESEIPPGSTATFHPPAAIAGGAALLIALAGTVARGAPDTSASLRGRSLHDVLVPYDGDQKPSSSELKTSRSIVYIQQPVVDQWLKPDPARSSNSETLIGPIQVRAQMTAEGQLQSSIHLSATTLRDADQWRVPLNLTDFALDTISCLVNGKPAPLIAATDGSGFQLVLTQPEVETAPKLRQPGQNDSESVVGTEPSNAAAQRPRSELNPRVFDIEIRGFPRVKSDAAATEKTATWNLPLSPSVTAFVELPRTMGNVEAAGVATRKVGSSGRTLRVESRDSNLTLRWSTLNRLLTGAEIEMQSSRIVEVSPACLTIRNHLRMRMLKGTIQQLDLPIPENVVVQKVSGTHVANWSVYENIQHLRRLNVEFDQTIDGNFSIDAVFLAPTVVRNQSIQIDPWDVDRQQDPDAPIRLILRQTALEPQSGYRLNPLVTESETVRTITPEIFARNASGWEEGRRAAAAWQMQESTPIAVTLQPVEPVKQVRVRQAVTIAPEAILIAFSAEIRTQESVAFQQAIELDPRLQIDSIQLKEDEADRLDRWTRNGSRLQLHLKAPTRETQDLLIRARIPITLPGEFDIPLIRVENAETEDSLVTLLRRRSTEVTLLDPAGLVPDPAGEPTTDETSPGTTTIGRFRLTSRTEGRPKIRIEKATRQPALQTVTRLERRTDGLRWSCQAWFELTGHEKQALELSVPRFEAGPIVVETVPTVDFQVASVSDASVIRLENVPESLSSLLVRLSAPARFRFEEGREIPLAIPESSGAVSSGDWFISTLDNPWTLRSEDVAPNSGGLPEWWSTSAPDSGAFSRQTVLRIQSRTPRLIPQRSSLSSGIRCRSARMEIVASESDGWSLRAIWQFDPTDSVYAVVNSNLPAPPFLVLVDGATTALAESPAENVFSVPLPSSDGVRTLEMRFALPSGTRSRPELPVLTSAMVCRPVINFLAPIETRLFVHAESDVESLSEVGDAILEAETWSDAESIGRPGTMSQLAALRELRDLKSQLDSGKAATLTLQEQQRNWRKRFDSELVLRHSESDDHLAFLTTPGNLAESAGEGRRPLNPIHRSLRVEPQSSPEPVTVFRAGVTSIRLSFALLVTAGLLGLARFLSRWPILATLRERHDLAALVLFIVWWIGFSQSLIGFLLLLVISIRILWTSYAARTTAEIHI